MAGSVFSAAISLVRIKISNWFYFTDRPSGILVHVRGFIVFHQPLYFLFAREKMQIPFMKLENRSRLLPPKFSY
jgi:hypothetical protein